MDWFNIATAVVAGASVALHVIAPLTKSRKDDAIVKWIDKILSWASLHKPQIEEVAKKVQKKVNKRKAKK